MDALRFTTSGTSGWTNVMYCSLLYLSTQIIPILGLIVMFGFFAEVHRRLVLRHPEPYVRFDFSDFSNYLSRGVAPLVMTLALAIPFALFAIVETVVVFLVVGAGISSAASGATGLEPLTLLAIIGSGLSFVPFMLIWLVLSNAVVTRAELTGDLTKAFALGEIWSYAGKTWKRALVTAILMSFVSMGLLIVGLLACFVGTFVTMSIQMLASLHVRWQIYNEYLLDGGTPIELAPWETLPSEIPKDPAYAMPPAR